MCLFEKDFGKNKSGAISVKAATDVKQMATAQMQSKEKLAKGNGRRGILKTNKKGKVKSETN